MNATTLRRVNPIAYNQAFNGASTPNLPSVVTGTASGNITGVANLTLGGLLLIMAGIAGFYIITHNRQF